MTLHSISSLYKPQHSNVQITHVERDRSINILITDTDMKHLAEDVYERLAQETLHHCTKLAVGASSLRPAVSHMSLADLLDDLEVAALN